MKKENKTISIGAGAGFSGDRLDPALALIESGKINYLVFECLAERTIAMAHQRKLENPEMGYDPGLEERMTACLPLCIEKGIKIITNMGAANPISAAKKVKKIAGDLGFPDLIIGAVIGDDVLDYVRNGVNLSSEITANLISANAYLGAEPIVNALKRGAEVIITGRCADPALFIGPVIYEFNWSMKEYDLLGKASVMGHLLECAGQLTGGYYADPGYKEVPDIHNLGFPYGTINEKGEFILLKLSNTGGLLNSATTKEQLLYEIHDPARYLTPDVIVDFTEVFVEEKGINCVEVCGGKGLPKTGKIKASIGFQEGYTADAQISYGGPGCLARGELAIDILKQRFLMLNILPEEIRYDIIGVNSLYQQTENQNIQNEVRVRVAARTGDKKTAQFICNEVEALYTNGPAGGGGVTKLIQQIIGIQSILLDENILKPEVIII